jgi:ADP-heptose:LPS heptosyltransferase
VANLCGETHILGLAEELASCGTVIGNDSGGMHLANALGTQTIVLFGPTNPSITSPFYDSRCEIIEAKNHSGSISKDLNDLSVQNVLNVLRSFNS